jgi:ketosteroid isomerase-like protein
MKICPACKTQYSDDTLIYCLQDGTPLAGAFESNNPTVVLADAETVVARQNVTTGDAQTSGWQPSQVTYVATPKGEKKGSTTAIAVAATVIGMLVLVGVIGIAALVYFKNLDGQLVNNVANANVPGGGTGNLALPTPQISPLAAPTQTRPTATPPASNTGDLATPPPTGDLSRAKSEVSQRVYDWKSMLESRDLNGYMGNYADTVDYYSKRNAVIGAVRSDKARAFKLYSSMRFDVSNMTVSIGATGDTATAAFDKEWSFTGRDTSSGKVRSQLDFRKINGRWLITAEKDLRVYYTR